MKFLYFTDRQVRCHLNPFQFRVGIRELQNVSFPKTDPLRFDQAEGTAFFVKVNKDSTDVLNTHVGGYEIHIILITVIIAIVFRLSELWIAR